MKLTVINDIHVAKNWDKIEKVIPNEIDYLNPNQIFRNVLASLKKEDTLVINGDLIDYYDSSYLGSTHTNWETFFKILDKFEGQKLLNLGNHDYRRLAYNFRIYDLEHVNIAPEIFHKYANKIGHTKFRFLREIKSIKNNFKKFHPITKKIPKPPIKQKWNRSELLLLNTKADACNFVKYFINPLNWRTILSSHPCSEGLTKNDINFLNKTLQQNNNQELIIFLHCPPFLSNKKIPEVKLTKKRYRLILRKHKLDYSMFLKNNWQFVESLLKSDRNITLITSHNHIAKQYTLNKENQILKDSTTEEINDLRSDKNYIKIVSTYPLGSTKPTGKIGYLTITDTQINYHLIKDYKKIKAA